jgi:hypothetical protein
VKLYEIGVGNEEGWSYFVPDESRLLYFTFCEECNWPYEFVDRTKRLKWQGGSDPGDFVSGIVGDYAKRHVADELATRFSDLIVRNLIIVNRADGKASSTRYAGEEVVDISANHRIPLVSERCTLSDEDKFDPCPLCGRTVGNLDGVELRPEYYGSSRNSQPNLLRRVPRQPGKGVFLYEDELAGHNFFYLGGSLRLSCTELVRNFIVERGYTHADLVEIGETIRKGDPIPIRFV